MKHSISTLNGKFGLKIEEVTRKDLCDEAFKVEAYNLWMKNGGLLAVRGADLANVLPEERGLSRQQNEDQDPQRPEVHLLAAVLPLQRLRSGVHEGTDLRLHVMVEDAAPESEINQLHPERPLR